MAKPALVLVGILLLSFSFVSIAGYLPLATILYPAYFWYSLHPGGTSTSPTLLTAGQSMTLSIKLVYYDATVKVSLPTPTYWKVTVTITASGYSQAVDFGRADDYQGGVKVDDHYCSIAVYENPWTVPTAEGVSYTFLWTVVIKDSSGTTLDTKTKTTYGKTASIEPDGYFTVNGQKATETATFVTLDGQLNLAFAATKNAEKITKVYVEVYKGGEKITTVDLTGSGSSWSGTYTLPSHGTYEVKGFFTWSGSTTGILKMSAVASWGEESPPALTLTKAEVLALFSGVLGILFLALGLKKR